MKPTETTEFELLCTAMRNKHYYEEALESLSNAAKRLTEQADTMKTLSSKSSIRYATKSFLTDLATLELNIELLKRKYINDIINKYDECQDKVLTDVYKRYDIQEG